MERITKVKFAVVAVAVVLLVGCAQTIQRIVKTPTWETKYDPPTTEKYAKVYEELVERVRTGWGFTVIDSEERLNALVAAHPDWPPLDDANGMSSLKLRLIILDHKMATDGKLEVLIHELGHFFQPGVWSYDHGDRAECEVFAEFVARKVGKYYKLDGLVQRSDGYLASYKTGLYVLPYVQRDIDIAFEHIVGLRTAPKFVE